MSPHPLVQLNSNQILHYYRIDSLYFISKFSQAYRLIRCSSIDIGIILN